MEIKSLSPELTVSGQINAEDIQTLQSRGVKSIICNRPDAEEVGQTPQQVIASLAEQAGIAFEFLPVISGQIKQQNVADFSAALQALTAPIHAYCRSGMRCTSLWALSEVATGSDRDQLLQTAKDAGYDISRLLAYS